MWINLSTKQKVHEFSFVHHEERVALMFAFYKELAFVVKIKNVLPKIIIFTFIVNV